MKYIVLGVKLAKGGSMEIPFVFPELLVHADMAAVATVLLEDQFKDSIIKPISAGFCSSVSFDANCYGKSGSMDLKSRERTDSALIKMSDYGSIHA